MSIIEEKTYYKKVQEYYNEDSGNFEHRYWENKTLQNIRASFRDETTVKPKASILEIGFGPGLDTLYFAEHHPESMVYGIDISNGMHAYAEEQKQKKGLSNLSLKVGSIEDIETLFPNQKFDLIYVYFGALNTVDNIEEIQHYFKNILTQDGSMVLTFVNKWYFMSILKPLVKLKFKTATRRLGKVWGGYSPTKFLASRCYSSRDIKRYFNQFTIVKKRGYSILYPAWYENHINTKHPELCKKLWKVDLFLQRTPFWNLGEYSLYIFKRKS